MSKSSIFKKIVVVLIAVFLLFGCSSQNPQPVTDPSNNKQETESNIETSTEPEHNEVEEVGNFESIDDEKSDEKTEEINSTQLNSIAMLNYLACIT
ncbi:MAG: hypothetical protein IJI66_04125 [Erysipelotrichaceae bacterium]|nr:hypothetical protein [Erysipelotrichaceae bacterium]